MKQGDKDRPLPHGLSRDVWRQYVTRISDYKEDLSRGFGGGAKEYEKFIASLGKQEVVLTLKYDGELNLCVWNGDYIAFFNKHRPGVERSGAGRMRTDILPLTDEMKSVMEGRGVRDAVFVGELYALSPAGGVLPFGNTLSIIKKPDGRDNQIYFAVFDILEINGTEVKDDYWKKCLMLQEMFKGTKHVHAVMAKKGGRSVAEDMWRNKVLDEKYEGFVVHTNGLIKVKPMHTYDLAVVGIITGPDAKSYRETGGRMAKTLALAWMDDEGNYRYCCNCGNGFNHREQEEVAKRLNPHIVERDVRFGKYTMHMVEPVMVVQIQGEPLPPRESESWKWDTKWNWLGRMKSVAIRFPRFMQGPGKFRDDKDATNKLDVRINQVPGFGAPTASKPVTVSPEAVEKPSTANPKAVPATVETIVESKGMFSVGDDVVLKKALGKVLSSGEQGVVVKVHPPTGNSPTGSYDVEFADKGTVQLGESILESAGTKSDVGPPTMELTGSKVVAKTEMKGIEQEERLKGKWVERPLW